MQDFVDKFFKPCELIMDLLPDMIATEKACFVLLQERPFIGCAVDVECLAASSEALVKTDTRLILIEQLHFSSTDEVVNARKVVAQSLDAF